MQREESEELESRFSSWMRAEHKELCAGLGEALAAGGRIRAAAQEVAQIIGPHLEKEQAYVLALLGAMPALAEDEVTPDMAELCPLADRLKAEIPHMEEEHKAILAALRKLAAVAAQEGNIEYAGLVHKMAQHARVEERDCYPVALVVGEYLELKLAGGCAACDLATKGCPYVKTDRATPEQALSSPKQP